MAKLSDFKVGDIIQWKNSPEHWEVRKDHYICVYGQDVGKTTGRQPNGSILMLWDYKGAWHLVEDEFDAYVAAVKKAAKIPKNAELRRFLATDRWEKRRGK